MTDPVRQEFEEIWIDEQENVTPNEIELAWDAWKSSRRFTIAWCQQQAKEAAKQPVALPGALVLPGDFFKEKK